MVEQVPFSEVPKKEILKTRIDLSLTDPSMYFSLAVARPNAPTLDKIVAEWKIENKRRAEESKKEAEARAERARKKKEELERETLEKEAALLVKPLLPEIKFNKYVVENISKEYLEYCKERLDKMRKLLNTFTMGKLPPKDAIECLAKKFDWIVQTNHCHVSIGKVLSIITSWSCVTTPPTKN